MFSHGKGGGEGQGGAERARESLVSSYKAIALSDPGFTLMTSFDLNDLHKGPISKYSQIDG